MCALTEHMLKGGIKPSTKISKERAEFEKQFNEEQEKRSPVYQQTQEAIKLQREIKTVEDQFAREEFERGNPDPAFVTQQYKHRKGETADSIMRDAQNALEQFRDRYLVPKGISMTRTGLFRFHKYVKAQDAADIELRHMQTFIDCFHRCVELGILQQGEHYTVERQAELADEQPKLVNEFRPGTREYERRDREIARQEAINELQPVWRSTIASFVARGFLVTPAEQDRIWQHLKHRNQPLTVENIQRAIITVLAN